MKVDPIRRWRFRFEGERQCGPLDGEHGGAYGWSQIRRAVSWLDDLTWINWYFTIFFLCSYCVSCKYPYSVYMWNCLTGTKQPIGFVFSHSPNQKNCAPLFISPGAVLILFFTRGVWNFELAAPVWKLKAFARLLHLILGENK